MSCREDGRCTNAAICFLEGCQEEASTVSSDTALYDICKTFGWRTDGDVAILSERVRHHIRELKHGITARNALLAQRSATVASITIPEGDSFKPVYWFSILVNCARLLNLPDDEPIPSGVLRAVSELVAPTPDNTDLSKLLKRAHRVLSCAALTQIGDGEATWRDLGEYIAKQTTSQHSVTEQGNPAVLSEDAQHSLAMVLLGYHGHPNASYESARAVIKLALETPHMRVALGGTK